MGLKLSDLEFIKGEFSGEYESQYLRDPTKKSVLVIRYEENASNERYEVRRQKFLQDTRDPHKDAWIFCDYMGVLDLAIVLEDLEVHPCQE